MKKTTTITVKMRGKRYTVQVTVKRKTSEAIKRRLKEKHRMEVISSK